MKPCERCGAELDAATDPIDETAAPAAGDASVCLYCGNLAVFTGNGLELRRPTEAERAGLYLDPAVAKIYRGLLAVSDDAGRRLSCGCQFAVRGVTLIFQPCSPTCDAYAYAIEQARKSGTEIALATGLAGDA